MPPAVARQPAAPAPPAEPLPDACCANCDSRLAGPFCHACGQRDTDHLASVREFFAHAAEVAVGYDSRLLRTARALFTRPGLLTAEYAAGRRARYASPLQVYLVGAALLFATTSVRPMVTYEASPKRFHVGIATMSVHDGLAAAEVARIEGRAVSDELFNERFVATTTKRLSTFLVLLVPGLALLVAVAFLRDRHPFAQHVLFALHWSAFFLSVLALSHMMPRVVMHTPLTIVPLFGGSAWYFVSALRRAYDIGWMGATLRGIPLFLVYVNIILLWLQFVTAYTLRHL